MTYGLSRCYGRGELLFITISCRGRKPNFASPTARNAVVEMLSEVRDAYRFRLLGYVVMPEHVHLLVGEPAKGSPSTVMQVLKQRVAKRLLRGARSREGGRHLWEKRFYDFNVWSWKKRIEKIGYMHMNPVNRGLVSRPGEWSWSSYLSYAEGSAGLISIDRD